MLFKIVQKKMTNFNISFIVKRRGGNWFKNFNQF